MNNLFTTVSDHCNAFALNQAQYMALVIGIFSYLGIKLKALNSVKVLRMS